ncbi:hypothetical protein G6F53_014126 [Rhizopus delemar]|nr:hypothetical protein G6F53_014126 [Rhizopus delemar]
MRAGFRQGAALQHQDQVGVTNGGQPVRDHERGAVAHQGVQRPAHLHLGQGVLMRGGFVQDQHRRVLQEGASDRNALALAA